MASYGSSSRFIFEQSRDITNFQFEKKLGICVPSRNEKQEAEASLDGYIMEKNIYVEAKCREIYKRNVPEFNSKYKEFYTFLTEYTQGRFNFDIVESLDKEGKIKFVTAPESWNSIGKIISPVAWRDFSTLH